MLETEVERVLRAFDADSVGAVRDEVSRGLVLDPRASGEERYDGFRSVSDRDESAESGFE